MKNIIEDTRDIQVGKNKIFLRLPMKHIPQEHLEKMIEVQREYEKSANKGNILAMLSIITLNQWIIWNKLK